MVVILCDARSDILLSCVELALKLNFFGRFIHFIYKRGF
jgi:hypothetical protein